MEIPEMAMPDYLIAAAAATDAADSPGMPPSRAQTPRPTGACPCQAGRSGAH